MRKVGNYLTHKNHRVVCVCGCVCGGQTGGSCEEC